MRTINEIIIHCSATPEGREVSIEEIRRWHRQRNFADIGYHYIIHLDGTVEAGRAETAVGAHCLHHNQNSIGICYIGGIDRQGKPKDTRTPAQTAALAELIHRLCDRYNLPLTAVHGHNEYAQKACPSFNVQQWLNGDPDTNQRSVCVGESGAPSRFNGGVADSLCGLGGEREKKGGTT